MEIKSVLDWFDIPRTEAPATARLWMEANFNPATAYYGFGLTGTSCSADIPDPVATGAQGYSPFSQYQTMEILLDKLDSCELFLVHDVYSQPVVPLATLDAQTKTYVVGGHSLSPLARENAEQAVIQARRNHGTLSPAPKLATPESTSTPVSREPANQKSGVALLLTRYAIGREEYREGTYAYNNLNLRYDFPALKRSYYTLRTLRPGFVYVYHEDSLECFTVGTTRLRPDKKRNTGNIRATDDALVFQGDGRGQEVFIAFSEHEWTDRQCEKIVNNEGGCRENQMQRFSLESPGQDTCPISELANQVDEYAGAAGKYGWWSDYPSHGNYWADARQSKLESLAGAQHVVALHDPTAITHDLTSLIEEVLSHIESYATKNHRKKIIAETIEALYAQNPDDVGDLKEHVRENERAKFLGDYREHINEFQQRLLDYKSDRHQWLSTAGITDQPGTIGTSWATYDFNSLRDWYDFEFSFVRSIGKLTSVAMPTSDLRNEPEFALLDKWASEPGSWLYKAVAPPDAMEKISSNWGLLGKISAESANLVKELHSHSRATQATGHLLNILTAYAVKTGAAVRNGSLAPGHIKNVGQVPGSLAKAFKAIGARHGFIITIDDSDVESVLHYLDEAAKKKGLVEEYVKAPNHRALDDAIPLFKLADANDISAVSKHPFRASANLAGSGIISAFSILNLAAASDALLNDLNGPSHNAAFENQLALTGAIVGLGEAAARGLNAVNGALPPQARGRLASSIAKKLASDGASKALSWVGLGLDLLVSGTKSYKQLDDGEFDAGLLYAASGATAVAGFGASAAAAVVLTGGTALIAIAVITVVSAVVSTLLDIWADSEQAGPVERWLDGSSWGNGDMKPALNYGSVEEEQEGLIRLIHEPVIVEPDFDVNIGFEHYLAEFKVFLPRFEKESSYELADEHGGAVHADGPWEPKENGVLISYRHYIRKSSHERRAIRYTATYAPSEVFRKDPIVKRFTVEHWTA